MTRTTKKRLMQRRSRIILGRYDLLDGTDINYTIEELKKFRDEHYIVYGPTTKIELEIETEYGCFGGSDDWNLIAKVESLESDEEYADRMETTKKKRAAARKAAETRRKSTEEKERAQLKKLLEKYPETA
jgi:hypothetical protein